MKPSLKSATIPGDFSALRFVCGCFGIGEKELTATLERMRSNTKNPDSRFPRTISRVMLMRAEKGKGKWLEPLLTIHREALYDRIRRDEGRPLFSFAGKVGEEIITSVLNLYRRLRPRLDLKRVSANDAVWILIEHVIVPTVFVKLAEEWRYGLGTELQGELCWYLPAKADGNIQKPIARVLDCWLRVAGFRTAYGVSQNLGRRGSIKAEFDDQTDKLWKAWKKSVERWLNGKPVQSIRSLHRLVESFARNVTWLDDANHWKARFTLAYGMQNLCEAMDARFDAVQKDSSLRLGEMLYSLGEERIACDNRQDSLRFNSLLKQACHTALHGERLSRSGACHDT